MNEDFKEKSIGLFEEICRLKEGMDEALMEKIRNESRLYSVIEEKDRAIKCALEYLEGRFNPINGDLSEILKSALQRKA